MEKEKQEHKSQEARILFLEDDETIREVLKEYMTVVGYHVTEAADGDQAIRLLGEEGYDLAVLDIMVPGPDGFEVLQFIRSQNPEMGVIMLTALDDEASQVAAFNHFADDYVVKPVSPILLLKRIETILRRTKKRELETGKTGEEKLVLKSEAYTAYYRGEPLPLTLSEFLLLQTLYEAPSRVFTREMLILHIYNEDYIGNDRIIDAHVKNLRKKLPMQCIKTVIGVGYQYDPSEVEHEA
ncbi:MAG: response regulator transcription factor [Lachnospiraceae bacterium]|nr:response regulator transcription factor [Lachnospiraceae bacterium]